MHRDGAARRVARRDDRGYYFAFGSDDFYLIADLPDKAAAAAAALTDGASGALGARTIVLLTPRRSTPRQGSPSYRPKGR
jgi:hypothetical protein